MTQLVRTPTRRSTTCSDLLRLLLASSPLKAVPVRWGFSEELLSMGTKIIGLKVGHRGLYLRTANATTLAKMGRARPADLTAWADREIWAPCFATQVVGTTGSGDATIAGFLMGLLRGMSPQDTLRAACAVRACNVDAADALSGVRGWSETAARWERLAFPLDANWQWDVTHEVWIGPGDNSRSNT